MSRPIVTFLTDFGLDDTFVGQMKAVVLSASPHASLVDLTHAVPPQSILTGAIHLRSAWHWFPEGTIHVVVVDPGVGTNRRAICIRHRGHVFLAPDNGILSGAFGDDTPETAVKLELSNVAEGEVSRTFHGRDVFARAAGRLASGATLASLGREFDPAEVMRLDVPKPMVSRLSISGEILYVDRWGNAVTNISAADLGTNSLEWSIRCGAFAVERICSTYADVPEGDPLAAVSSMDTVEMAIRNGSAAARYDLEQGMAVEMTRNSDR